MGSRGPVGSPFGRRAESRRRKNPLLCFPPEATIPPATKPDMVAREPHASAFWDRHAPDLARAGLLNAFFDIGFAFCCLLWADVLDLGEMIERDGTVLTDARGRQYPHPAVRMEARAMRDYLIWAKEFGLTPAARHRLPVEPIPPTLPNPWEDLT